MAVPLGSAANVREILEMLDVIESTRFESLPGSWSERVSRSVDYHPGRSGPGGDFFYYEPFELRKVSEPVALSRAASARTCPINLLPGWVHNDGDTERTPRDARLDFNPDDDPYLRPAAAVRTVSALHAGSDDARLIPASVHRDEVYPSEAVSYTHLTLPTILLV